MALLLQCQHTRMNKALMQFGILQVMIKGVMPEPDSLKKQHQYSPGFKIQILCEFNQNACTSLT